MNSKKLLNHRNKPINRYWILKKSENVSCKSLERKIFLVALHVEKQKDCLTGSGRS